MPDAKLLLNYPFATAFLLPAVPAIDFGLRLFGFRTMQAWTGMRQAGRQVLPPAKRDRVEAYLRIAGNSGVLWSRLGGNGTCLRQALAVRLLLRLRGEPVDVVLGMRIDTPRPAAHAWLSDGGQALGQGDRGCVPLATASRAQESHRA